MRGGGVAAGRHRARYEARGVGRREHDIDAVTGPALVRGPEVGAGGGLVEAAAIRGGTGQVRMHLKKQMTFF